MPTQDNRNYSIRFPRPRGAVAWILTLNVTFFFLTIIAVSFFRESRSILKEVTLIPYSLFAGHIWQLATYSFIDFNVLSILFSSLMIYSMGSMFPSRKFMEIYFTSLVGGSILAAALSYTKLLGIGPTDMVYSAWPGVLGLIGYRAAIAPNDESYMFLFMIPIKEKHMALIFVGMEVAMLLLYRQLLFVGALCGILTGFVFGKMMPRRGMKYAASEGYFGIRNSIRNAFYRWRRKRATRKFEVYMSKQDRKVYFDQYGNYVHPEDNPDKGKDDKTGRSGWVN